MASLAAANGPATGCTNPFIEKDADEIDRRTQPYWRDLWTFSVDSMGLTTGAKLPQKLVMPHPISFRRMKR
jgi:hypothetical protein